MQQGKCSNFGNCDKADSREILQIPDGQELVCPICRHQLTPVYASGGRSGSPARLIGIVLLLIVLIGGGLLVKSLLGGPPHAENAAPSAPVANTPASPPDTTTPPPVPPVRPGDILMYYERSDEKWLQQAAADFNQKQPDSAKMVLDFRGSREGKQDILYGKGKPAIWNPADVYWPDKLNRDWKNPQIGKHTDDIVTDVKPILNTMLVLVMHDDHARVFIAAMQQPNYRNKTWTLLYDIATKGWSAIGGQPGWGKLKLAQSNPIESNSGMVTLSLMFNEYRHDHPDARSDSPDFLKLMRGIESAAPSFQETTSKALDAFVNSPDQYDLAIAYEQNAITTVDKGAGDLRVVYPAPTVMISFPAAILQAPWVTSDQSRSAHAFVDYLLTRDVQQHAIDYGFRPALPDMRSAVDNAFSTRAKSGFTLDPPTLDRPVESRIIDDLLYQWNQMFKTQ